jgi:DNA primase
VISTISQLKKRSELYEKVTEACTYILHNDPVGADARAYLNSRISSSAQKKWEFGYFPSDDNLDYLYSLVDKDTLKCSGALYKHYLGGGLVDHGHFHDHNLVMPFRDYHGDIVALLGRSLLPDEKQKELNLQKYKYSSGSIKDFYVFGLDKAYQSIVSKDYLIGVEGQFDCIALHEEGVDNAVAMGWANVSRYQLFKMLRFTRNIVLMFDADEAGSKGKQRARKKYSLYANLKSIAPPNGYKDIDEFLRRGEDPSFRKTVIHKLMDLNQEMNV